MSFMRAVLFVSVWSFAITSLLQEVPQPPVVLAQGSTLNEGPPPPPMLPEPPENNGPLVWVWDTGDCDIELEFDETDFPPPVNENDRAVCSGAGTPEVRGWAWGIYMTTVNGYHTEGEASIRNSCTDVHQTSAAIEDSLVATLSTVGAPGFPPPPGLAEVESHPLACVLAYVEGMARATHRVVHDVSSSSTDVDRVTRAEARSDHRIGPSVGGTIGGDVRVASTGGGMSLGMTRTIVYGLGVERAYFEEPSLSDCAETTQEVTRVCARQQASVWARWSSSVNRPSSYAQCYIEQWEPRTLSLLSCGGDNDLDGLPDNVISVDW